ncbi:hypothetical protein [Gordonia sp. NB41Y]|uniref:hypothetical protein n=1 Tax=Gordonia sp. NB41Y TaxID=875808 RepID=UPI0002BFF6E9|nr:hypothetical protein [Gordonia sp. NB41Y]WLP90083.1 hypothetical protein Q9K23_21570 [Gordonia sp. NB41Y]
MTDTTEVQPESIAEETSAEDDSPTVDEQEQVEPDTFDRAYVEKLRQENGKYRQRAQQADELAHRLHRALVEQTGRLQDASDLPFDDEHLRDGTSLASAIDELLTAKPHLAARRPVGDIGQGATANANDVNLLGLLGGH